MAPCLGTTRHFQLLPWIIQVSHQLSPQGCSWGERLTALVTSLDLSSCHYYYFSLEIISLMISCYPCRKADLARNPPLN